MYERLSEPQGRFQDAVQMAARSRVAQQPCFTRQLKLKLHMKRPTYHLDAYDKPLSEQSRTAFRNAATTSPSTLNGISAIAVSKVSCARVLRLDSEL